MVAGVNKLERIKNTFFQNTGIKKGMINDEYSMTTFQDLKNQLILEVDEQDLNSSLKQGTKQAVLVKPSNKENLSVSKVKLKKLVTHNYSEIIVINDSTIDELVVKTGRIKLNNTTIGVLKTKGSPTITGKGHIGKIINLDWDPVTVDKEVKVDIVRLNRQSRIKGSFTRDQTMFQSYSVDGYNSDISTDLLSNPKMLLVYDLRGMKAVRGLQEHDIISLVNLEDGLVFENRSREFKGDINKLSTTPKSTLDKLAREYKIFTFLPEFDDGVLGVPLTIVPPYYTTYRDKYSPYATVKVWYQSDALVPQIYQKGELVDYYPNGVHKNHGGNFSYFEFQPDSENIKPQFRLSDYYKELGLFEKPIEVKEKQ